MTTFADFGCDFESVRRLLDPHCSIDDADKSGGTALHCAAAFCFKAKIVQLLLDNGSNTDRKNKNGETALDIARQRGWGPGVTLLTPAANIDKIANWSVVALYAL